MLITSKPVDPAGSAALLDVLRGRRAVVLAGAGVSTESGIPDYRGPDSVNRNRKPMQYQEFVRSEASRARYWARSAIGWPRMAAARPNAGHTALADLEASGLVQGVITQNVDGLHQAAGSRRVVELHGSLAWVCCLACGARQPRDAFQAELTRLNPDWAEWVQRLHHERAEMAPDGDAEVPASAVEHFEVPPCAVCGGVMKPDVVFFGENVPRARVDDAWGLFESGDVLLVLGSSLTVFSGRRFADRARSEGKPIAIVNVGPTRADDFAAVKIEARIGAVLPEVVRQLAG